jgi:hypothetical protein
VASSFSLQASEVIDELLVPDLGVIGRRVVAEQKDPLEDLVSIAGALAVVERMAGSRHQSNLATFAK